MISVLVLKLHPFLALSLAALLLATLHNRMWYAVPLVVTISLVYAATRHEEPLPIFSHAIRFGIWILVFMAIVMAVLIGVDWLI